ncbi:hypothetical protein NDU88_001560 [Pleurodeles waltl]|uniref:Uncharacterized protein n=1 Tax=Pleurodeles waltl TaxID=8319 RepID=A0AAV7TIM6_PLEWA|nr:hypothetical protein NDU88_001560 [Pleurodeles waltl]
MGGTSTFIPKTKLRRHREELERQRDRYDMKDHPAKEMKFLLGLVLLLACFRGTYSGDAKQNADCSVNAAASTVGPPSGPTFVRCTCKTGFAGSGTGNGCNTFSTCTTARCCVPGSTTWSTSQKRCLDVNECNDANLNTCAPQSTCINIQGNHLCSLNRALECSPGSTCDDNTDCVKLNGVYTCADPCENYQTLSGLARLSSADSKGVFPTDRYLSGWFRYVGNAGVRLKEGCIGPVRCGSGEPYTLQKGSHPILGSGIQTAKLMSNLIDSTCKEASSILIKACPNPLGDTTTNNGFYVYKFFRFPFFDVYCTGKRGAEMDRRMYPLVIE